MTSPLSQMPHVYDLDQALASLRSAAKHHTNGPTYLPRDLMVAAVAFTIQLAIESGHDGSMLLALEGELIAGIETAACRAPGDGATPPVSTQDGHSRLTNDEVITIRDELLAKGDIGSLSVRDQNLFRDCDITLGVVRCQPQAREKARARITRMVTTA